MLTKKLQQLTSEQERALKDWRADWYRVGTCTEPAERQGSEAAISAMYREIGKPAPHFVWVESPATACLVIAAMRSPELGVSLGDSLWASFGDSLGVSLWDSLGDSLGASLRASLWASLGASLWDSLWASLGASLWASLWDSLRASLWASLRGQHEAYWVAFYLYCEKVLGIGYDPKRSQQLALWADLCQCGWWWPYENWCIVSERPSVVSVDERECLHRAEGPALAFRDGYGVWAWHGVRVPQQVIEGPESLKAADILGERNVEVRRVMIERLGADRFLRDANAERIAEDEYGVLWRVDLSGDEPLAAVEVVNGTPEPDQSLRRYMIRVPPTVRTPREAVAWTYGMRPEDYRPMLRT